MKVLLPFSVVLMLVAAGQAISQKAAPMSELVRATPAYSEILLRKTELSAELESLAADYTDESPKIQDLRFEVATLERAMQRLAAVKTSEAGKLSLALGKLLVKRASLEAELQRLLRGKNAENVDVRRVRKKIEVFDNAIREILP